MLKVGTYVAHRSYDNNQFNDHLHPNNGGAKNFTTILTLLLLVIHITLIRRCIHGHWTNSKTQILCLHLKNLFVLL